jgi:hypothetical protein
MKHDYLLMGVGLSLTGLSAFALVGLAWNVVALGFTLNALQAAVCGGILGVGFLVGITATVLGWRG